MKHCWLALIAFCGIVMSTSFAVGETDHVFYGHKWGLVNTNWYWLSGKDNSLNTACCSEVSQQITPGRHSTHSPVPGRVCAAGDPVVVNHYMY